MRKCRVDKCDRSARPCGLCSAHMRRLRRTGSVAADVPIGHHGSPTCAVTGCHRGTLARGWCSTHYARWQQSGSVGTAAIRPARSSSPTCSVEGCQRQTRALGYCSTHYWRSRKHGDPGSAEIAPRGWTKCTVDGCPRKTCGQGLCRMHYERQRKGRPLGPAQSLRRSAGEGHVTKNGYVTVTIRGRTVLEHRHRMEQLLGRPLEPHETVHHVNGDRSDNTVEGRLVGFRSGNLELWSKWQPAGQRVQDKVRYAIEILDRYLPEALAPQRPLIF